MLANAARLLAYHRNMENSHFYGKLGRPRFSLYPTSLDCRKMRMNEKPREPNVKGCYISLLDIKTKVDNVRHAFHDKESWFSGDIRGRL